MKTWRAALLATAAFVAGLSVQRHLAQRAREELRTDPLTRLPNRLALAERIERYRRYDESYAVGLLDLNNFKPINDTFGHRAGDELLVALGQRMAAVPNCMVVRLSGDEFAVVMSTTANPKEVAAQLYGEIARPVFLGEEEVAVTAAIGLVLAVGPHESWRQALHAADTAMYHAKRAGSWIAYAAMDGSPPSDEPSARLRDVR